MSPEFKSPRGRRPPLLTRVLSFVIGCAMWLLWLWLIVPAPISEELRRRIVETSLSPSIHVVHTLALLYVGAVLSCQTRKPTAIENREREDGVDR